MRRHIATPRPQPGAVGPATTCRDERLRNTSFRGRGQLAFRCAIYPSPRGARRSGDAPDFARRVAQPAATAVRLHGARFVRFRCRRAMASRKDSAEATDTASSAAKASGPVPRGERETTPAPSITVESPSCRPTAMPPFDLSTLAGTAGLGLPADLRVPLDLAVPLRTAAAPPEDLSLRASFLLLHVDGQTSIAEIAGFAQLGIEEVSPAFVELLRLGLVEIAGEQRGSVAPTSGPRPTRR